MAMTGAGQSRMASIALPIDWSASRSASVPVSWSKSKPAENAAPPEPRRTIAPALLPDVSSSWASAESSSWWTAFRRRGRSMVRTRTLSDHQSTSKSEAMRPMEPQLAASATIHAMQFGIGFLSESSSREVLDWARDLERHEHLDRLWVADEQFLRDPWVQLGAIAAVTSRVSIGICVTDPYIRHPALTATAAATLQELSGGRALLGLGAGSTGFGALGLEPRSPARAVRECIELCRKLWSEPGPFSYRGEQVRFHDDRLDFKPPSPIPIYVAARGPKML